MSIVRTVTLASALFLFVSPLDGEDKVAQYVFKLETIVAMATRAAEEAEKTIRDIQRLEPSNLDDSHYSQEIAEFRETIGLLTTALDELRKEPDEPFWVVLTLATLYVLEGKADNIRNAALIQSTLLEEWDKGPIMRRTLRSLKERFDVFGEVMSETVPLAMSAGNEASLAAKKRARALLAECKEELESGRKKK